MIQAIALARRTAADPLDFARMLVVAGCAMALIAAGHAFPL
jgi:hypothetical protein